MVHSNSDNSRSCRCRRFVVGKRGLWLVAAAIILLTLILALIFAMFGYEIWCQNQYGPGIMRRYGFDIDTPYINTGSNQEEVIQVSQIAQNGVFARSAINVDDVIIWQHSICELYKHLDKPRGTNIQLTIAPYSTSTYSQSKQNRVVVIIAP